MIFADINVSCVSCRSRLSDLLSTPTDAPRCRTMATASQWTSHVVSEDSCLKGFRACFLGATRPGTKRREFCANDQTSRESRCSHIQGLSCACTSRACHPVMICFQDTVETRWREREGKTSRWSSNHSDRIVIQQQQQHHHHSHIPADDNPSCTLPKTTSSPYRLIPSPPLLSSAADSFSY
jgi:hypothetical protein